MLINTIEMNFKKQDGTSYKVKIPYAKGFDEISDGNTKINELKDVIMEHALVNNQKLVECVSAELVVQEITELTADQLV